MSQLLPHIPPSLIHRASAFQHGAYADWPGRLPALIARCRERWSLTLAPPYEYPSLSYVAPATRADGSPAVLKVGFLLDELSTEVAMLRLYDGVGMARLLEFDLANGCLLLQRIDPGDDLTHEPNEAQAITATASVMRKLRAAPPPGHPFPTVQRWLCGFERLRARFDGAVGPLPPQLVARAEELARELLVSMEPPVVLHGDLQHFNLLRNHNGDWVGIDPKGVVGEPAYEVGAFLRNQLAASAELPSQLRYRLDGFSRELSLDRNRLRDWAMAQAVLSAWWTIEDNGDDWTSAIACAQALTQI